MNIRVARDGSEIGEWSEDEVAAFYREGRLLGSDHYWKPGMSEWALLATFIQPPPPPAPKLPPLPSPKQHQGVKLGVAIACYTVAAIFLSGICGPGFGVPEILGTWIVDAAFSGPFWFIYAKSAKPTRLRSFLVFAGISILWFLIILLGKYGSST